MLIPRIRTVKPELFNHEGLFEAEQAFQLPLRLAFIALFTCCDRHGRFRWQPRRLKLDMLPYDDIDVSRVLDALATRGFIVKYEQQGEYYGCIPSWPRHQKVNHRESKSILPSPGDSRVLEVKEVKTSTLLCAENHPVNPENIMSSAAFSDARLAGEARVPHTAPACPGGNGRELEGEGKRKGKGREGNNNIVVASKTRLRPDVAAIQQIFEHWKTVMHHPNAKLDPKRKAFIGKALSFGYTREQLCQAISGCSVTPHNMGDNDRGQRYDGLHVILRDSDQIDRFIHNYHYPPRPKTEASRKTEANVHTLQRWLDKKLQKGDGNGKG